ncbi:dihydrolipoamide acetyltransferase family protein [Streptomyces viridochromogenes]|uniref:dihydrolipoamide acetyltransferase family protein n=1 Tax=Streptomyces viridochromogenes TaxID=1938 RepID=UPI00069D2417|nr:dihydrolipoamide acetyltransferase family protein [Streptomyces viridochromogenes]KOG21212.1 branched-chain alpha-keto acid dehydrogenase subunit E2 [Streptomyces viridochromogenes]KOG22899.1 branched-chain alpha-keto acid dehydrogenase subunit E2 [Streptomyces viridochromogenes]
MAQVLEFRLPDLGEGLTEAEIVRWLVEVGDVVAVDQPVVEVETAKAMVDIPCPYAGVVTARFGEEGRELPVGAPLLTVAVGAPATGAETEGSGNVLVGYGTSEAPARRRRVRPTPPTTPAGQPAGMAANGAATREGTATAEHAPAPGVARPVGTAAGHGPAGHGPDVAPADEENRSEGPVPVISPLVRRLAREHGLDLRELHGSGPDGLILRADVEYALRAAEVRGRTAQPPAEPHPRVTPTTPAPSAAAPPTQAPVRSSAPLGGIRTPLKGIRGAVADKLSRSRREIPDATCWVDADATELMRARTAMNAAGGPKISLLALLARISTAALARFPELNATVDMEAREVIQLDHVHLGFAAQTERGLVVPVVRDAHARDAESLTAEFARLTEAARGGTLTPAELTGGTFTLNNYGVFGVDGSTPIINHPEAAMLGVGRIIPKPWVHEGELAVRQVVELSLTFDHRVCDGGTAGGFLRYVADCVEHPAVLLRTL